MTQPLQGSKMAIPAMTAILTPMEMAPNARFCLRAGTPPAGSSTLRTLTLVLALAGWHSGAQAFFCFTFGGHARHHDYPPLQPWRPPPPMALPALTWSPPPSRESETLPPIRETKKSPDIIQGYRFRPLDDDQPTLTATPPADWRD